MTIELRISGAAVTQEGVAAALLALGVEASITATSNVCKAADGTLTSEPGAHILLPDCSRESFATAVWPTLKRAFALRCGWLDASQRGFRGCTENYCAETLCPMRVFPRETCGGKPPECAAATGQGQGLDDSKAPNASTGSMPCRRQ